jgi:hypothetical protein
LDLVFSPVTQPPRDLVFAITLRFRPAFEPESQVIIRQGRGQTADVEYLAARRKVSTTVDELLRTKPEAQPGELARAVRVQRRIFKLPAARAFALQAGLFASLNETMSALRAAGQTRHRSGVVSVTLDGESYDLWYEQGLTKFSGSFSASEADLVTAPNAVGIGQWARALHDEMIHAGEADR